MLVKLKAKERKVLVGYYRKQYDYLFNRWLTGDDTRKEMYLIEKRLDKLGG